MRRTLVAGALVVGLLSGGALAASPKADVDSAGLPSMAVVARDQFETRALIGKIVVDRNGDAIGTVADVLIDASGKAAETAIIKSGGAAGIGEKLITVPIAHLKPVEAEKTLRVEGLTRQQVSDMKLYRQDETAADTGEPDAAVPASLPPSTQNPADLEPRMLIGHEVVDENGNEIGTVDNVLLSDSDNRPAKAIVKSGGFLGLGTKLIAVDFASLRPAPNQTNNVLSPGVLIATGLTREQVRQMEGFRYDPAMRTYRPSGS
jgi:sporulation protein YlmC with PRC-barrel domain